MMKGEDGMAEDKRPSGDETVRHVTEGKLTGDYTFGGIEDLPDVMMALGGEPSAPVSVKAFRMDNGASAGLNDMSLLLLFETAWPDDGTDIRFVVERRTKGSFRPSVWDMGTLKVTSLDTVEDGVKAFVEGSVPLKDWTPKAVHEDSDKGPDWSQGGTSGDAYRTALGMSYVGRPMLP